MTLAGGLLVLALAIGATLSHARRQRMGQNGVVIAGYLRTFHGTHRVCQRGERIPAGTEAIRMSVVPGSEPRTTAAVEVAANRTTVASGEGLQWDGNAAIVRLRAPVAREVAGRVCVTLHTPGPGEVGLIGGSASAGEEATLDGASAGGRMRVDYLRDDEQSWLAFAPTVLDRMGRGRAWSGRGVGIAAALLLLTSIGVASWRLVRTSG